MKDKWEETTLGEIMTLQRGYDLPIQNRNVGSVPIIASTGIAGYHNEAMVRGPGVVIGRSGSIGGGQYIDQDFWPLNTTLWVKDFKGNDPRYCYYLLKSLDFSGYNVGSGVPTLNRNHIHPTPVAKPPLDAQLAIAGILGSLDDKIQHNRKMNETLEAIAKAIFQSWFVDFDPVHAKMAGKKPVGMDDATVALFPDSFEPSELGEIPSKWKVGTVKDIADVVGGGTPSTKISSYFCSTNDGVPWITPKDLSGYNWKYIGNGATNITQSGLDNSSVQVMPRGTVLFSSRAPIGYIAVAENDVCTNQGFKSLVPTNGATTEFIYYWAKANADTIEARASGSTFKEISGGEMKNVPLCVPDNKVQKCFAELMRPISSKQEHLRHETNCLISTRDLLLPKLISGEIEVK